MEELVFILGLVFFVGLVILKNFFRSFNGTKGKKEEIEVQLVEFSEQDGWYVAFYREDELCTGTVQNLSREKGHAGEIITVEIKQVPEWGNCGYVFCV